MFHDTGFIVEYDNNEPIGAKIAKNYLRSTGYDRADIYIIENIIIATRLEEKPKNIYEQIVKDADMDNLGRDDFFEKSDKLKQEIEHIKNISLDNKKWDASNFTLISTHTYYTKTQHKERDKKRQENMQKLKEVLEK